MSFRSFFKKLIKSGVNPDYEDYLNDKIRISNQVAIFICVTIAIPFIFISWFFFPPLVYLPLLVIIGAPVCIFLNAVGMHYLGRALLSILPIILTSIYGAYLAKSGEPPVAALLMVQLSFCLVPFLVFAFREKVFLFSIGVLSLILFLEADQLNTFFEAELDNTLMVHGYLSNVITGLSGVIIFVFMYFLLYTTFLSNSKSERLFSELEDEKSKMKDSEEELKLNLEKLRQKQEVEKIQQWSNEGLARVTELWNQEDDFQNTCDKLISFLVKYSNSVQGGLYLVNEDEESKKVIDLVSCYAYERKKFVEKRMNIGQGLIGQAYLEKDYIHVTEIPQDYVKITSGLGERNPSAIIVMPLITSEEVYGVVELARFETFRDYEIEFLRKSSESIGTSIRNSKISEHTKVLLEQSQQQAEELQAQEEEMRQNLEEMEATQEEVNRISEMNKQVLEQAVDAVITIDENKLIIFFNQSAIEMFGYDRHEVLGKNVKMIVPEEHKRNHDKYIDDNVTTGTNKVIGTGRELQAIKKDGTRFWIILTLSKVKYGGSVQYTAFIKDMTKIKNFENSILEKQAKVELKSHEMESYINALSTSIATIDFDPNGIILNANENFCRTMECTLEEIKGKHHRIFVEDEYAQSSEYKLFWSQLASGEAFINDFQRKTLKGNKVWLRASYAPVPGPDNNIEKIIKFAHDISDLVGGTRHEKALA